MRALWAWRLMMLVAVASLALLAGLVATQLPHVVAQPGQPDLAGLMGWAGAVALGVLALLGSVAFRRRGRMTPAIVLVAAVALPALAGIGVLLLIVLLFILKG